MEARRAFRLIMLAIVFMLAMVASFSAPVKADDWDDWHRNKLSLKCPDDIYVDAAPGRCDATVYLPEPTIHPYKYHDKYYKRFRTKVVCYRSDDRALDAPFPVGRTKVTCYLIIKRHGYKKIVDKCHFFVIVRDRQAPTIACPPSQTVNSPANACAAPVTIPAPTVADNCPGATSRCTVLTGPIPAGTVVNPGTTTFPVGTTTIQCVATDASGNTSAPCTFTITVRDVTPPTLAGCPTGPIVRNLPCGEDCPGRELLPALTPSDNCPGVRVEFRLGAVTGPVLPADFLFPVGETTVVAVAIDAAGNQSAPCTFVVDVNGTISGTKFYDYDKDGYQDDGEYGVEGVKILLIRDYRVVARTRTDENGNYCFEGLEEGTYFVREVVPYGFKPTTPKVVEVVLGEDCTADVDFGNVRRKKHHHGGYDDHYDDRDDRDHDKY